MLHPSSQRRRLVGIPSLWVPGGHLSLMIECPRYLFPFARRLISDVTAEGGFPPFQLDPIDFAGVYAARKAQGQSGFTGAA